MDEKYCIILKLTYKRVLYVLLISFLQLNTKNIREMGRYDLLDKWKKKRFCNEYNLNIFVLLSYFWGFE